MTSRQVWRIVFFVAVVGAVIMPTGPALAGPGAWPAGLTANDVVLMPTDVGPDFVLAASGEQTQFGFNFRVQTLVRANRLTSFVEPAGLVSVRSFALVARDGAEAERYFDQVSRGRLFEGTQEVGVPPIGDRVRGALVWGGGPFDTAGKIVLFRRDRVLGIVMAGGYEPPTDLEDALVLARLMAGRAGG